MNRTAAFVGSDGGEDGPCAPLRREKDPHSRLPQAEHSGEPKRGLPG